MATLGELKTSIATKMVRDDLLDDLADELSDHISDAIEYFSDEELPFNAIVTTGNCTASTITMDIPATVRRIDRLTIPASFQDVREVGLEEIERLDTATGLPYLYCYYNDQIRLYPTPDQAYTLQFTGLKQIAAPTSDLDGTTVWTNQAKALISARTRMTLYRDQFRDTEGAQNAMAATKEALDRLKQEAARRLETPLRGRSGGRGSYNIYSDR